METIPANVEKQAQTTLYNWVREEIVRVLQKIGQIKADHPISHEESNMIDKLSEASFWAKLCDDNLRRDAHTPNIHAKVTIKEKNETVKTQEPEIQV